MPGILKDKSNWSWCTQVHYARTASPRETPHDQVAGDDPEDSASILRKASIHGVFGTGLMKPRFSEGELRPALFCLLYEFARSAIVCLSRAELDS